jgi:hypothetical protein
MRKIATILCLTILSSSLAGCLWNPFGDDDRISFSDCPSSWHVEFFDHSNDNFGSWDGKVEFTDSNGNTEVLEGFSSNKKYVTLDESLDWTMKYTFYEGDIGFIVGDTIYGGDNRNGDSGTIELDLVRKFASSANDDSPISFSCRGFKWDIKFVDQSNENFGSWGGEVEFFEEGNEENSYSFEDFSSDKKYVTLQDSKVWIMKYTFYEEDIGFIYAGKSYGMNNDYGDSGEIRIDLT